MDIIQTICAILGVIISTVSLFLVVQVKKEVSIRGNNNTVSEANPTATAKGKQSTAMSASGKNINQAGGNINVKRTTK